MERTVPTTESEEIELYTRTYYSLLRSTAEVQIRTLEEAHNGMRSLMHVGARDSAPDMSAFIYSLLRLPACIADVEVVILGQSGEVFARGGYPDVFKWQNDYYMVVESYTQTFVRLYRATAFPDKWEYQRDLLTGDHFISPTLVRCKNMWWMFTGVPGNA